MTMLFMLINSLLLDLILINSDNVVKDIQSPWEPTSVKDEIEISIDIFGNVQEALPAEPIEVIPQVLVDSSTLDSKDSSSFDESK
ncbi:hypothetical protein PanWU01x14_165580, partial [Parasponia andersonii]